MAVTKIKAIKSTLKKALDYIMNPDKTDEEILVSGFGVDPKSAYLEYKMTADYAAQVKDKDYSKQSKNLAYHTIQSFQPGDDVTPDEAHEIGKKLADQMLGGKYEYVVTTHVDKGHIHNHIIFNATSFETHKKFDCHKKKWKEIRQISDKLCLENGLHVINNNSKIKGKSHKEWQEDLKGTSWKSKLKDTIEQKILTSDSFDDFIEQMEFVGYEVKLGKHISFRAPGQERFARAKSLGEKYTQKSITNRILEGEKKVVPAVQDVKQSWKSKLRTAIDYSVKEAATMDEFLMLMVNEGYEVKEGKYISFRAPGQERFTRAKSLGENYSKENLLNRIENTEVTGKEERADQSRKVRWNGTKSTRSVPFKLENKIVHISRKARLQNIQQLANTISIIKAEGVTKRSEFKDKFIELQNSAAELKRTVDTLNSKVVSYNKVAKMLTTINQYQDIYDQYQKLEFNKDPFYSKHETKLKLYEIAEANLIELQVDPKLDVNTVLNLAQKFEQEAKEIKDNFNVVTNRINKLQSAEKTVLDVLGYGNKRNMQRDVGKGRTLNNNVR